MECFIENTMKEGNGSIKDLTNTKRGMSERKTSKQTQALFLIRMISHQREREEKERGRKKNQAFIHISFLPHFLLFSLSFCSFVP